MSQDASPSPMGDKERVESPIECEGDSPSPDNRLYHNELEKHRRAQLKECLERLKELVPMGPDAQKHTTLSLLTRSRHFIKTLQQKDQKHTIFKDQLLKEQKYLKRRLEQLQHLAKGGAIGVGNSTLRSANGTAAAAAASSSPMLVNSNVSIQNGTTFMGRNAQSVTPHILKRRQNPESSFHTAIISSDSNMVTSTTETDNFCLLIDEMELMEGVGIGAQNNEGETDNQGSLISLNETQPTERQNSHRLSLVEIDT